MTLEPTDRIADLKKQIADTEDAGASLVVMTIESMGATPDQMERLADEYQSVSESRQRSRITGVIAGKIANRLKEVAERTRRESETSDKPDVR